MALATGRNLPAFDEQINSRRLQDGGKRHEQPWRCVPGHLGQLATAAVQPPAAPIVGIFSDLSCAGSASWVSSAGTRQALEAR